MNIKLTKEFYTLLKDKKLKEGINLQLLDFKYLNDKPSIILSNSHIKANINLDKKISTENIDILKNNLFCCFKIYLNKIENKLFVLKANLLEKFNKILGSPIWYNEYQNKNDEEIINSSNIEEKKSFTYIKLLSNNDSNVLLKVRCINKTTIKEFHNKKGKLFNCEFIDNSGWIKACFFNKIIDLFYNKITEGNVYEIYNICIKHSYYDKDLNIFFKSNSIINELPDDKNIRYNIYNLVTIDKINTMKTNKIVDVICVCLKFGEILNIKLKNGSFRSKRYITIIDDTCKKLKIVLWGDLAETILIDIGSIVIIKNLRISEYNNIKEWNYDFNSKIIHTISKDEDKYNKILNWKNKKFENYILNINNIFNEQNGFSSIKEISNKNWINNNLNTFNTIAYILYIKDSFYYISCKNSVCKKKVTQIDDKYYECISCGIKFNDPVLRYLSILNLSDTSGTLSTICIVDDINNKIFNKNCEQLVSLKNKNYNKFKNYIDKRRFIRYKFTINVTLQKYNNTSNIKYYIVKMAELDVKNTEFLFKDFIADINSN